MHRASFEGGFGGSLLTRPRQTADAHFDPVIPSRSSAKAGDAPRVLPSPGLSGTWSGHGERCRVHKYPLERDPNKKSSIVPGPYIHGSRAMTGAQPWTTR